MPSQLVYWTDAPLFWWSGPIVVFVIVPLIDWWLGDDGSNPSAADFEVLNCVRFYRWCTWLFLPIQFAALLVACVLWRDGSQLDLADKAGLALSVGVVAGMGINVAHELGHRHEGIERWLAKITLSQSLYGHFYVEHNRGHHVRVATPDDPASARMGESLYAFVLRSVTGGFRSALRLERARLARRGLRWWSIRNDLLQSWAMSAVVFAAAAVVFGAGVLPFLLLQAAIGVFLLESVNYVEHYGLLRERRPDGRYRRVTPRDSWNSDRIATNILLFHVQRHSDHHANPGRRYQTLRTFDESPQLPFGYATMILAAMVPWLWRKVIDPQVASHYDGDLSRANLAPRLRASTVEP
ncbi:alkane 1-monooxygenase [Tsukamurella soli]|uniref:Alkane 1-monooxygenase n=1 Tax=Tsukamurella soli TaxID=644556 RepID=A0ABP8JV23_9ACTN